jgi:hypothetical protein
LFRRVRGLCSNGTENGYNDVNIFLYNYKTV